MSDGEISKESIEKEFSNYFGSVGETKSWFNVH
jgi:hypothetical protein